MQKAVSYETAFDGIDYESQEFLEEALPSESIEYDFPEGDDEPKSGPAAESRALGPGDLNQELRLVNAYFKEVGLPNGDMGYTLNREHRLHFFFIFGFMMNSYCSSKPGIIGVI